MAVNLMIVVNMFLFVGLLKFLSSSPTMLIFFYFVVDFDDSVDYVLWVFHVLIQFVSFVIFFCHEAL